MIQLGSKRPVFKQTIITLLLVVLIACVLFQRVPSCPRSLEFPALTIKSDANTTDAVAFCHPNPYLSALQESPTEIIDRMDTWLRDVGQHATIADRNIMAQANHARFSPFNVMSTCNEKSCVGGPCGSDVSKIVCGLTHLKTEKQIIAETPCIVYSIGGNNQWEFELDVLEQTSCHVHTFDCTGALDRFKLPPNSAGRLHFHHVCLGTVHEASTSNCDSHAKCGETWTLLEMQQRLNHMRIDLLKMDIEGFEWPLLESWPTLADATSPGMVLPMQILTEIHYRTGYPSLLPPSVSLDQDFRHFRDIINLEAHFLRMGYVVVERDDNMQCFHCTELTLLRAKCHSSGPNKISV